MTQHPRYMAPCLICGATPTRAYISGPRCSSHTPAAERGRPEPPQGSCAPARCYCGKPSCPAYETYGQEPYGAQALAWAAVDAPAVASGKRRASPQTQAAARDTVQHSKDRDAALRRAASVPDANGDS